MNTKYYLFTARSYATLAAYYKSIDNAEQYNYYMTLCKAQIQLYKRFEALHETNIIELPKMLSESHYEALKVA